MIRTSPVREVPIAIEPGQFREIGRKLIDELATFLEGLPERPVAPGKSAAEVQALLGGDELPAQGAEPGPLLERTLNLLLEHQAFNGHPRFWGYITSSPAPIGALADLIVSVLNPNAGLWQMAPLATEIELQTARWIAELLGYPVDCGGVFSSGGQTANFVGLVAARRAMAPWDVRTHGAIGPNRERLRIYASNQTHAWLNQAANIFGFGTGSISWVPSGSDLRMEVPALRIAIAADRAAGDIPMAVIGTAGSVSTGAVDPLEEIAAVCREERVWFHVDGAYGAPAVIVPEHEPALRGLREADSIAVDPHKWLYAPIDAGCTLLRRPDILPTAFGGRPDYYVLDDGAAVPEVNLYELGPENSRRFRALKVWLALQQVGRAGYERMIADDIALARHLHLLVSGHPSLEAWTHGLSITTFRYVPPDLREAASERTEYLNTLNRELVRRLQAGGEVFPSNAVVNGVYLIRACIVNFRTTLDDIQMMPGIAARLGETIDRELRPEAG